MSNSRLIAQKQILIATLKVLCAFNDIMNSFSDEEINISERLANNDDEFAKCLRILINALPDRDENTKKVAIESLLRKFLLGTDKDYGTNSFDLSLIGKHLGDDESIEKVIWNSELKLENEELHQILNIVVKVASHFRLTELMPVIKKQYPANTFIQVRVEKYINEEGGRYPHSLEISRPVECDEPFVPEENIGLIIPWFGKDKIVAGKRHTVLKTTFKNIARLKWLTEKNANTPLERKYGVDKVEKSTKRNQKVGTYFVVKINGNTKPHQMPGPIMLGPITDCDKLDEIISEHKISAVVSIEEKMVSLRYFKDKEAYRDDWLKRGVTVYEVETPDLVAMSLKRTLIAANALVQAVTSLKSDEKVLIHCKAGIGRSATTLITAYMFYPEKLLPQDDPLYRLIADIDQNAKDKINKPKLLRKDVKSIIEHLKRYRYISPIKGQKKVLIEGLKLSLAKAYTKSLLINYFDNELNGRPNTQESINELINVIPANELSNTLYSLYDEMNVKFNFDANKYKSALFSTAVQSLAEKYHAAEVRDSKKAAFNSTLYFCLFIVTIPFAKLYYDYKLKQNYEKQVFQKAKITFKDLQTNPCSGLRNKVLSQTTVRQPFKDVLFSKKHRVRKHLLSTQSIFTAKSDAVGRQVEVLGAKDQIQAARVKSLGW